MQCSVCGKEIKSKANRRTVYCSRYCLKKASHQRQKKNAEEAVIGLPPLEHRRRYKCQICGATVNHKPPCYACQISQNN